MCQQLLLQLPVLPDLGQPLRHLLVCVHGPSSSPERRYYQQYADAHIGCLSMLREATEQSIGSAVCTATWEGERGGLGGGGVGWGGVMHK